MRTRRHHNNDGRTQIRRGKTRDQVRAIAARLGVPFSTGREATHKAGDTVGAAGDTKNVGQGSIAQADEKSARTKERAA